MVVALLRVPAAASEERLSPCSSPQPGRTRSATPDHSGPGERVAPAGVRGAAAQTSTLTATTTLLREARGRRRCGPLWPHGAIGSLRRRRLTAQHASFNPAATQRQIQALSADLLSLATLKNLPAAKPTVAPPTALQSTN